MVDVNPVSDFTLFASRKVEIMKEERQKMALAQINKLILKMGLPMIISTFFKYYIML